MATGGKRWRGRLTRKTNAMKRNKKTIEPEKLAIIVQQIMQIHHDLGRLVAGVERLNYLLSPDIKK